MLTELLPFIHPKAIQTCPFTSIIFFGTMPMLTAPSCKSKFVAQCVSRELMRIPTLEKPEHLISTITFKKESERDSRSSIEASHYTDLL
jgi:hypothetical protein